MEQSPRFVIFLLIFVFIILPDQQSFRHRSRFTDERLEELRQVDFDVITNTTYGEHVAGLNLTGFRQDEGYQWDLLDSVKNISRDQHAAAWHDAQAPVYQHLSGEVRGSFIQHHPHFNRSNNVNITALMGEDYTVDFIQRNVSENVGEISLALEDFHNGNDATDIKATISIYTESSPGNGWEANLHGVHFPSGHAIFTTVSRKFNSLPAFPLFALDEAQFNQSKSVINGTLTRAWDYVMRSNDIQSFAIPECELVVWLQQRPVDATSKYLSQVETELEIPDGAPIGTPPPMSFSTVIFSPDCGYLLEADVVHGPKLEAYWTSAKQLLSAFIIIVAMQIALLKRQMEKCATPSTRSRISYFSIGISAFGDGLILFAMTYLVMTEERAFLLSAVATFLCIMQVAFFEVKFVFDIWTVQVGDPAQAQRDRQRRNPPATETLPLPVTTNATDGATPIITSDQQDESRVTFSSLYTKFYFGLINLAFFSLWAMSWPRSLRSAYINLLAFCYFSLWLPQIYRNIMRNCRKALEWEFVIGSSFLRCIPVLYWYIDGRNVLAAKPNPSVALMLFAWLWMQLLVMISQQFLGPRLLVKESWCPPAYEYHPILSEDMEAQGLPIGALTSASEGKEKDGKTRQVFDCAICMNEVDVPVLTKDEKSGRSWLEQRNYMVTPCRHIFHTKCLEGWMNLRLVCPVCREGLPPL